MLQHVHYLPAVARGSRLTKAVRLNQTSKTTGRKMKTIKGELGGNCHVKDIACIDKFTNT